MWIMCLFNEINWLGRNVKRYEGIILRDDLYNLLAKWIFFPYSLFLPSPIPPHPPPSTLMSALIEKLENEQQFVMFRKKKKREKEKKWKYRFKEKLFTRKVSNRGKMRKLACVYLFALRCGVCCFYVRSKEDVDVL